LKINNKFYVKTIQFYLKTT